MISFQSIFTLIVLLLIVPFTLGQLCVNRFHNHERYSLTLIFVVGYFITFTLFYIPAVPMILLKQSFSLLTNIWVTELIVACLVSVGLSYKSFQLLFSKKKDELVGWLKESWFIKGLTLLFIILVMLQSVLLSQSNLSDTDDARYIAEGLDAIRTDQMLLTHPITGETLDAPIGEMTKDVGSPFMLLEAAVAELAGIHVATLCHVVLPLVFIPICYMVYWLLADRLFEKRSKEKKFLFLVLVCIIMMFGKLSAYWESAYLLWRIWQGKAILRAIELPFLLWVMLSIMKEDKNQRKQYYIVLFITCCAGCLLTPMGSIFPALILGVYTLIGILMDRDYKLLYPVTLCYIPLILNGLITVMLQ